VRHPEILDRLRDRGREDRIVVVDEEAMRSFARKRLAQLLDHPARGRVLGDVEVEDSASSVVEREPYAGLRDRYPVASEAFSMPANDCLRLDDDEGTPPAWPETREGDPEGAVQRPDVRPPSVARVGRELLPQRQFDDRLLTPRS
jgi:hypothetical protein